MALTGAQEEVWFCASKWASRPASPWLRAKPGRIWSYSRLFSWAFKFILSGKCQYDTPEVHEFNNVKVGFPLRKDILVETESLNGQSISVFGIFYSWMFGGSWSQHDPTLTKSHNIRMSNVSPQLGDLVQLFRVTKETLSKRESFHIIIIFINDAQLFWLTPFDLPMSTLRRVYFNFHVRPNQVVIKCSKAPNSKADFPYPVELIHMPNRAVQAIRRTSIKCKQVATPPYHLNESRSRSQFQGEQSCQKSIKSKPNIAW